MNKEEFNQALKRNRISYDEFAAILGRSVKTVYEFGDRTPVPHYARWAIAVIDMIGPDKAIYLAGLRKIGVETRK